MDAVVATTMMMMEEVATTKRKASSRQHFWARRVSEGSDLDAKPDIS
jgi:hypothetical protein